MGNIFNGHWYHEDTDGGWNCSKCANDDDFALPYIVGDDLFFQLKGYDVTNAYLCDWSGNRILNLKSTLGPNYWRKNISDDLKLFTLRIPPELQLCENSSERCCCIDLTAAVEVSPGLYNLEYGVNNGYFDGLYLQGSSVNILTDPLPAGWSFGEPNGWLEHIIVPCEMLGWVILQAHKAGDPPGTFSQYEVPVVPCVGTWCDCYVTIDILRESIHSVIIDGITYNKDPGLSGNILEQTPINVPGFCKPSKHSEELEVTTIPIKCDLMNSTIVFIDSMGNPITGVFSSENCTTHSTGINTQCWMIEFEIDNGDGTTSSIYSEPYECVMCEPTVVIRSDYRNVNVDCLGQVYDLNIPGTTMTGNLTAFQNKMRIPAVIRNLPSRFGITSNVKCFNFKSEIVERFELQGTKPIPPYLARMIENIMVGSDFYIDNVEYQIRGESAFDIINEKAISAYRLKASLEACPCEVNFEC